MEKAALISVSDRVGLADFANGLLALGYRLLATSGSGRFLAEQGIAFTPIEEYTGQPEILDGRVKTLHPKIHGGLLARRDNPQHLNQLSQAGILPIDVAVVNLYPFIEGLKGEAAAEPRRMIELIDIGGPTMIRAAAKNFQGVWAVIDPADYPAVLEKLQHSEPQEALTLRRKLAAKVFVTIANYNLEIAKYLSALEGQGIGKPPAVEAAPYGEIGGQVLVRRQELRYGENPHQKAVFYAQWPGSDPGWQQLQGKELSYNNLLDFDAALKLVRVMPAEQPAAVIIKHLNPCGAACDADLCTALRKAKRGDPRSQFGGIIACNREVTADVATEIVSEFAELVVAPSYQEEALAILRRKQNLRVMRVDLMKTAPFELRSSAGGILCQEPDRGISSVSEAELVSTRKPFAAELEDLQLAWLLCAHLKSNAIAIVKDGMLLAGGAGQTSRIDSVELALHKARTHDHDLHGAVAASDAFFPFSDCVETLAAAGVTTIIAPRGAMRDDEVAAAAGKVGVSLLFASERHFRH